MNKSKPYKEKNKPSTLIDISKVSFGFKNITSTEQNIESVTSALPKNARFRGEKDVLSVNAKPLSPKKKSSPKKKNTSKKEIDFLPNVQTNSKAYMLRYCYNNWRYFCWDPRYEEYMSFHASIDSIRNEIIREIQIEILGYASSFHETKLIDFVGRHLEQKLFSYLMGEYFNPFTCLCKQIIDTNIDAPDIGVSVGNRENCEMVQKEFSEMTTIVDLRDTGINGRTENIENHVKEGDELELHYYGTSGTLVHAKDIEVFTNDGYSIGSVPYALAICLTPLVLKGDIDVIVCAKNVESRKMRGKRARNAKASMDMTIVLKKETIDESLPVYRKEICEIIDEYKALCKRVATYESDTDLLDFFMKNFCQKLDDFASASKMYKVLVFNGSFGYSRNREQMICKKYEKSNEWDCDERFMFGIYSLISNVKTIQQIPEGKYDCSNQGFYYVLELQKEIETGAIDIWMNVYTET